MAIAVPSNEVTTPSLKQRLARAERLNRWKAQALIAPLTGALGAMLAKPDERETAVLTFAATGSGVALFGIGSAFWGLVVGFAALAAMRWIRPRA